MLVEWVAALELQQRGTLKAVVPMIIAATDDFGAEATAAFGGLQALPDRIPEPTLEKVRLHLKETTGDGSMRLVHELIMQESGGGAEPTVGRIVAALLKYQGAKLNYADAGVVGKSVARVHAVVTGCMQRVGAEDDAAALFVNPMEDTFGNGKE